MSEIYLYNKKVNSVFELLGLKENDISYSVGWAFANSYEFLRQFLKHIKLDMAFDVNAVQIKLQRHEREKGFTDFEIVLEGHFHIIIEAKRGWEFPSQQQLQKYASRPSFMGSNAPVKKIIVFNESTEAYTNTYFNSRMVSGIEVETISWKVLRGLAMTALKKGKNAEKRLLNELIIYLEKISTMQKLDSNWVYVVSLGGNNNLDNWSISFRDIVNKKSRYFHPVGGNKSGWPPEPPNYIAFRYDGQLQSIHHIEKYEVFIDPSNHFPEAPKGPWHANHYLYHLGPAMKPNHVVKAGQKIIRSMRVWAMLDLLLTCNTIQEARDKSKTRETQS